MKPAHAVKHTPGRMNKTEARYADRLAILKAAGEIEEWWFEPMAFRLGVRFTYRPDFLVQYPDGTLEFVEVKAWWRGAGRVGWREDARSKWKGAAEMWPIFRWKATWERNGSWEEEVYGGA